MTRLQTSQGFSARSRQGPEDSVNPGLPYHLLQYAARLPAACRVLEVGTKRWGERPTSRKAWLAERWPDSTHVGCDRESGPDVDVVADLETLSSSFPAASFDLVVMEAVLEHVARPWVAAGELARVLAPGGLLYVQTHQTFPLHYYPQDYWRFSKVALGVLFGPPAGVTLGSGYEFPTTVLQPEGVEVWNAAAEAFLNVWCVVGRAGP